MLGLLLLIMGVANPDLRMAPPASRGVIIAIAILLLVVAFVLVMLTRSPSSKIVSAVALGNVTSGFVLAFWLIAGWPQFSAIGQLIVVVTIAGLLLLAIAELLSTMSL